MKDKLQKIGTIIFALPFGIFGLMHLMMANNMTGMVPSFVPGGVFWVYVTGLALVAAAVSIISKKQIYLATLLLAGLLAAFILTIHIPGLMGGNQMSMAGMLKDLGLLGGSLLIAGLNSDD